MSIAKTSHICSQPLTSVANATVVTYSVNFICCICEIKCSIYCNDNVTQYLNLLIIRRCLCDQCALDAAVPASSTLVPRPHHLCTGGAPLHIWRRFIYSHLAAEKGHLEVVLLPVQISLRCARGHCEPWHCMAASTHSIPITVQGRCGDASLNKRDVKPTGYPNIKSLYCFPHRFS
jgi:hypothetical protein